jgi:hypothetical protein
MERWPSALKKAFLKVHGRPIRKGRIVHCAGDNTFDELEADANGSQPAIRG